MQTMISILLVTLTLSMNAEAALRIRGPIAKAVVRDATGFSVGRVNTQTGLRGLAHVTTTGGAPKVDFKRFRIKK